MNTEGILILELYFYSDFFDDFGILQEYLYNMWLILKMRAILLSGIFFSINYSIN